MNIENNPNSTGNTTELPHKQIREKINNNQNKTNQRFTKSSFMNMGKNPDGKRNLRAPNNKKISVQSKAQKEKLNKKMKRR